MSASSPSLFLPWASLCGLPRCFSSAELSGLAASLDALPIAPRRSQANATVQVSSRSHRHRRLTYPGPLASLRPKGRERWSHREVHRQRTPQLTQIPAGSRSPPAPDRPARQAFPSQVRIPRSPRPCFRADLGDARILRDRSRPIRGARNRRDPRVAGSRAQSECPRIATVRPVSGTLRNTARPALREPPSRSTADPAARPPTVPRSSLPWPDR